MGKIRIVGVERRARLPEPEELARKVKGATSWIKSGKVVVHYHPSHGADARRFTKTLHEALKELGLEHVRVELRGAEDHPDGDQMRVLAWLGKKKLGENALHVAFGPFEGKDRFGNVDYKALAVASLGGLLAVHPEILKSAKVKELIIHEVLHLLGYTHEHPLPIMNPLNPTWDERSREHVRKTVEELLRIHGADKPKKKPWWRFW